MGVNASKYVEQGRNVDILEQIKKRDSVYQDSDLLNAASEEIMLLRDRLRGLRQKLRELGEDTDLT